MDITNHFYAAAQKLDQDINDLVLLENVYPRHTNHDGITEPDWKNEADRLALADLVVNSAKSSAIFIESRRDLNLDPLGFACGGFRGAPRTYLFALMTADAVKEVASRSMNAPIHVLEVGTGTGTNAVAALKSDPRAHYIGYERDKPTADYARSLLQLYNLSDRATIIEADFFEVELTNIKADIVINENIDPNLFCVEKQLEIARRIMPITSSETLFVPSGFDLVFGSFPLAQSRVFGHIDMANVPELPFSLSYEISSSEITDAMVQISPRMFGPRRLPVQNLAQRGDIPMLPMSRLISTPALSSDFDRCTTDFNEDLSRLTSPRIYDTDRIRFELTFSEWKSGSSESHVNRMLKCYDADWISDPNNDHVRLNSTLMSFE